MASGVANHAFSGLRQSAATAASGREELSPCARCHLSAAFETVAASLSARVSLFMAAQRSYFDLRVQYTLALWRVNLQKGTLLCVAGVHLNELTVCIPRRQHKRAAGSALDRLCDVWVPLALPVLTDIHGAWLDSATLGVP